MPLFIKGVPSNTLKNQFITTPNSELNGILASAINYQTPTISTFGNLGSTQHKWFGGVLAPNGKIYGIPYHATQILEIDTHHIPKNPDMCLHPYFNKF